MNGSRFILISILSIILMLSCAKKETAEMNRERHLVAVNGHGLDKDLFTSRYQITKEYLESKEIKPAQIKNFIEKFYLDELYFQAEAYEQKMDQDSAVVEDLMRKKINSLIRDNGPLYNRIIPAKFDITERELLELYKKSQVKIKLAHIMVASKQLADSLFGLLKRSADFNNLAESFSQDEASARAGGVIPGYLTVGMAAASFEEAAFKQRIGQISNPVKTANGYHIIKVLERSPIQLRPFPEEKERLTNLMESIKVKRFVQNYIDSLFIRFEFKIEKTSVPLIVKSFKVTDNLGFLDKNSLPSSEFNRIAISYSGGHWTLVKLINKYNDSPRNDRQPLWNYDDLEKFVQKTIIPELMYQDAVRLNLDKDPQFDYDFNLLKDAEMRNTLRVRMIDQRIELKEEEVQGYYEENKANWKNEPYEKVKSYVRNRVRDDKLNELREKVLKKLRKKYDVVYNDQLLAALAQEYNAQKAMTRKQ